MQTVGRSIQIFDTRKTHYWLNGLLEFLVYVIVGSAASWIFLRLFDKKIQLDVVVLGLCLLIASNILDRHHVNKIELDHAQGQVRLYLDSFFSGEREKQFPIRDTSITVIENKVFSQWLKGPTSLQMDFPNGKRFLINKQFGFSNETLENLRSSLSALS